MPRLEITLLGTPEIKIDGKVVKTDRRKAVGLLAYLSVSGKSYSRDHLAALLWPDYPQDSAYAYLRRTLWELNQMLGKGWIILDRDHLAIQSSSEIWLDTVAFEQLSHTDLTDITAMTEAVTLYRGDFLEGFSIIDTAPFEDWQFQQAEYFRRKFAGVLEKLVNTHSLQGEHSQALPYARRWLALDPLNETAHCAIMRLLAEMGDRTGAIRQYETCVHIVKNELGVPPQPETTKLYQDILQGEVRAAIPDDAVSLKTEESRLVSRLPAMPTPFIGRRVEIEQIKTLIQNPTHRLITLTGPGGTGKTRLSIQAATEVCEFFPDGVYFSSLATVPTVEGVLPALAKTLEFSFYRDERPRQQLLDFLREKRLMMVLDNFEHLMEASDLVVEILANAPGIKLLITSRIRLNLQGEQLYLVGGMRSPEAGEAAAWDDPEMQAKPFSAVQLFLERARRVQPNFMLTKANVKQVMEICHLVQGMPLALELAAAWLELLPPVDIAAEITRSLDFLETNQVDVPNRQRSIRAIFESSWKLLSEGEQVTLQRLCVFRGSFSRQAAQQVSGATLRTLLGLVNKSWLQQTVDGRFHLHELLHHYGEEQLRMHAEEWQEAHDRHAAYFSTFVAEQNLRMRGDQQLVGMKAFEEELNSNIKAAWDWLVSERRWEKVIDPFAMGIIQVGLIREQVSEMIPWLREARLRLAADAGIDDLLALAVISTLEVFCEESEYIQDHNPSERIVSTWQFTIKHQLAKPMGFWFVLLASLVQTRNLASDAEEQFDKAVDRLRQENDPWKLGIALLLQATRYGEYALDEGILLEAEQIFADLGAWHEQGVIAELLGRHGDQQKQPFAVILAHYQQAKQCFNKMGDESRTALNFMNLAGLYFREGMIEKGFIVYQETQRVLEKVGNIRMLALNLHWESLHAVRYSNLEHALDTQQRSLELVRKQDNQSDFYWGLFELGDIYRVFGEPQKASALYEQAFIGFNSLKMVLALGYYERAYGDLAFLEGKFSDALVHYEQYAKYAKQDNHAWSMAHARAKLALTLAYLENREQARLELHDILSEIHTWREDELTLITLLVEAVCLIHEGKREQAIELAAFIQYHPVAWNETKQQAQVILESAMRGLSEDKIQATIQYGKELKLDSVINAIINRVADRSNEEIL
jgi:predicted ATPase/DNA-binding SARP family transcriptional activator